jgi:predicted RNA-binding Zn-ribbon protein involved in translation (DUF1610 family)
MPAAPAPAPGYGMVAMKCQGCGGTVDYRAGQGYFECKFCGSRYNAATDAGGNSIIQTLELRRLTAATERVGDELALNRLQKKACDIQDKIDFKFVEFFHSWPRKAGNAAVLLWIIGGLLALIGLFNMSSAWGLFLFGLVLIGAGVGLFLGVFKKAEAAHIGECNMIKAQELNTVFEQLRGVGADLAGGTAALGYTESTRTPLRYCVACHKNVTPEKNKGGGGGTVDRMNLALTICTCGAWLFAWMIIALLSKAGGAASRAIAKGFCPQCGTTPLFPARIPNV